VVIALFNWLPIPPLDGGRMLAGLLPTRAGAELSKLEPVGLFIVLGLSLTRLFAWLFSPAYRGIGQVISAVWVGPHRPTASWQLSRCAEELDRTAVPV
jgi:Zn-dependent protease